MAIICLKIHFVSNYTLIYYREEVLTINKIFLPVTASDSKTTAKTPGTVFKSIFNSR